MRSSFSFLFRRYIELYNGKVRPLCTCVYCINNDRLLFRDNNCSLSPRCVPFPNVRVKGSKGLIRAIFKRAHTRRIMWTKSRIRVASSTGGGRTIATTMTTTTATTEPEAALCRSVIKAVASCCGDAYLPLSIHLLVNPSRDRGRNAEKTDRERKGWRKKNERSGLQDKEVDNNASSVHPRSRSSLGLAAGSHYIVLPLYRNRRSANTSRRT